MQTEKRATVVQLTPPGRGAVAAIRLTGELPLLEQLSLEKEIRFFVSRNGKSIADQPRNRILFGSWGEEDLVVCKTTEECLEIFPHGGNLAVTRILEDLESLGAERVLWDEDLRQRLGSWMAEYKVALARCTTAKAAEYLLHQKVLGDEFKQRFGQKALSSDELHQASRWSEFGLHLTIPRDIVVGGPPNVGKSSLINRLLGYERAIVYDRPGTTRDIVSAETAIDGWPVMVSDTAGQRISADHLESTGIAYAIDKLQSADVQLLVLDQSKPPDEEELVLLRKFPEALVLFHKADLPRDPGWRDISFPEPPLEVSSQTGQGLPELIERIAARLVSEHPPSGQVYPVTKTQQAILEAYS